MKLLSMAVLGLALFVSACSGDSIPTAPSSNVSFSAVDLQVGTGVEATSGRNVAVNYTGWIWSASGTDNKGAQFDSNAGFGPISFQLGVGRVIQGWDRGLVGMKVGGRRRLVIPPDLAYGNNPPDGGRGTIRANETLVFDVELVGVQ